MLSNWQNVRKVLAIQIGSQQDLMTTIPVLKKLCYLMPGSKMTLMVSPCNKQLGFEIDCVDDVLVYEDTDIKFKNSESELALISRLQQYAFDASVIFTNAKESPFSLAYICYLAGIPIRVGQSEEFGGNVLSHCVQPEPIKFQPFKGVKEQQLSINSDSVAHHLFLVQSVFEIDHKIT